MSANRTPFLRLSFACHACGAQQSFDKPLGSMKRYLAAARRMEPLPYIRCSACKRKASRIWRGPEVTTEIPTFFERIATLNEATGGMG
jgi:hypothetical protein